MPSNLRSKKMTPEQAARRECLLKAFEPAIELARSYTGYTTKEDQEKHTRSVDWMVITYGTFKADPHQHDVHILELLKTYGLKEDFELNEIKTLSHLLGKAMYRLEQISTTRSNKTLPFVLKAIHIKYQEALPSLPISPQAWHSMLIG